MWGLFSYCRSSALGGIINQCDFGYSIGTRRMKNTEVFVRRCLQTISVACVVITIVGLVSIVVDNHFLSLHTGRCSTIVAKLVVAGSCDG